MKITTEVTPNNYDFFWFEEDTIADWLGFDSFEDLIKANEDK